MGVGNLVNPNYSVQNQQVQQIHDDKNDVVVDGDKVDAVGKANIVVNT
jgi:hypothetical protein